jgi:hypothetical protein
VTPCAEFCNWEYSNITMFAAHNSPFIMASNQYLDVTTTQLNDGIRLIQA